MKTSNILHLIITATLAITCSCGKQTVFPNPENPPHRTADSTEGDDRYAKAEGAIRFVQYNVGSFCKFKKSIPDVASILGKLEADAVSLNELDSCTTRANTYQLQDLVTAMGGKWDFSYFSTIDNRGGRYGIGVMANAAITRRWGILLPKISPDVEQRGLCVMETERYVLASAHLNQVKDGTVSSEVSAITAAMKEQYSSDPRLVVLCGDFNMRPNTPTLSDMKNSWSIVSTTGFSTTQASDQMFDYVMVLRNGVRYTVTNTNVVKTMNGENMDTASDHYPVFADIKF